MDGLNRIGITDRTPELRNVKREKKDGKGWRPFNPSLIIEDAPPPGPEESTNGHHDTPVGRRPDDETGATIDVTA